MNSTNTIHLKSIRPASKVNGAVRVDCNYQSLASLQVCSNDVTPTKSEKKPSNDSQQKGMFKSGIGAFLTALGSAVGTGNIWRFPKSVASQSDADGALAFYIVWGILLFTWSIPLLLIETALGRFTKNAPPGVFIRFWGRKFLGFGLWFYVIAFFIAAYYQVLVGWCFYYLYVSVQPLPATKEEGEAIFNAFVANSWWPLLTQLIVVVVTGIIVCGGINWIEYANIVIVPILWSIMIFMFAWAMTRPYAEVGIAYLFTPNWSGLLRPELWMSAIAQNGFDTNAGMGTLLIYGTHMPRETTIVMNSVTMPALNNFCSFFNSLTIYGKIFSIMVSNFPTTTRADIVDMMRQAGPASTGLTFTWMPVLLSEVGMLGRIFCFLFFLALSVAGVLSYTAIIKSIVTMTEEFGIKKIYAVLGSIILNAAVGSASALNLNVLANQDNTWAYGLVISGILLSLIVLRYGQFNFFRVLVNHFTINDWKIRKFLIPFISILVPVQGFILFGYWIYGSIANDPNWNKLTITSLSTTFLEWAVAVIAIIVVNIVVVRCWKSAFAGVTKIGCDPYDPNMETVLYGCCTDFKSLFSHEDLERDTSQSSVNETVNAISTGNMAD